MFEKIKNKIKEFINDYIIRDYTEIEEESFIEKCISGKAYIDQIDSYENHWYEGLIGRRKSLYEYLGITYREYINWIDSGRDYIKIKEIIDSRIKVEEIDD